AIVPPTAITHDPSSFPDVAPAMFKMEDLEEGEDEVYKDDEEQESNNSSYCPSDSDYAPRYPSSPNDIASGKIPARRDRSSTYLPVPVPNLTKKSRGRKVPVSGGQSIVMRSKDKMKKGMRTYTCTVNGCGKCFVRGEHLKRHVRSIHTNEKPFCCPVEDCDRAFSRRDNLGQHIRIHKS
ncbi:hypothetical protein SERLADRAFT_399878, partial [Serpula lacrymans var. lacrymans S7.9]